MKFNESNYVQIIGKLGNDPEGVSTDKSSFSIISIAENRSKYNRETKTWESLKPNWFDVLCFDGLGDLVKQLKTGDEVFISGSLSPVAKVINGKKITSLSIIARSVRKVIAFTRQSKIDDGLLDFFSNEEISFDMNVAPRGVK